MALTAWFVASATGQFGYPQPVDEYESLTYSDGCLRCGISGEQRAPFRFLSEPKARHSDFLQLNWLFDELFVTPSVRDELQQSALTGFDFLPALRHRTGEPLQGRVQLRIQTILPPALDPSTLQPVTCRPHNEEWTESSQRFEDAARAAGSMRYPPDHPYCGRVKYHRPPSTLPNVAASAFEGAPDIAKSNEWFGSGGAAHRLIICSERFVELVKSRQWRGIRFSELQLSP